MEPENYIRQSCYNLLSLPMYLTSFALILLILLICNFNLLFESSTDRQRVEAEQIRGHMPFNCIPSSFLSVRLLALF